MGSDFHYSKNTAGYSVCPSFFPTTAIKLKTQILPNSWDISSASLLCTALGSPSLHPPIVSPLSPGTWKTPVFWHKSLLTLYWGLIANNDCFAIATTLFFLVITVASSAYPEFNKWRKRCHELWLYWAFGCCPIGTRVESLIQVRKTHSFPIDKAVLSSCETQKEQTNIYTQLINSSSLWYNCPKLCPGTNLKPSSKFNKTNSLQPRPLLFCFNYLLPPIEIIFLLSWCNEIKHEEKKGEKMWKL